MTVRVLAVSCSPSVGGRTRTALEAVAVGARAEGADVTIVELGTLASLDELNAELDKADAFVFGSPMYRASYAAPFKALMDQIPRGLFGADRAPLTGRAVLTVATAASDHHLLAPSAMRDILVDFFAAHLVSPGLYVPGAGYDGSGALTEALAGRAELMGRALVELATAIGQSRALRALTPSA